MIQLKNRNKRTKIPPGSHSSCGNPTRGNLNYNPKQEYVFFPKVQDPLENPGCTEEQGISHSKTENSKRRSILTTVLGYCVILKSYMLSDSISFEHIRKQENVNLQI